MLFRVFESFCFRIGEVIQIRFFPWASRSDTRLASILFESIMARRHLTYLCPCRLSHPPAEVLPPSQGCNRSEGPCGDGGMRLMESSRISGLDQEQKGYPVAARCQHGAYACQAQRSSTRRCDFECSFSESQERAGTGLCPWFPGKASFGDRSQESSFDRQEICTRAQAAGCAGGEPRSRHAGFERGVASPLFRKAGVFG